MGGLTKARAVRDLAVSAGIAMNIEDTWGGDIVTADIVEFVLFLVLYLVHVFVLNNAFSYCSRELGLRHNQLIYEE